MSKDFLMVIVFDELLIPFTDYHAPAQILHTCYGSV